MPLWLIPLFALTALVYASVGFAGGSTYTALLVLAGVPFAVIPLISLACNIVVSTNGLVQFARAGHIPWRRAWPILILSMLGAWMGGRWHIDPGLFTLLLGGSLTQAGLLLFIGPDRGATRAPATDDSGPGVLAVVIAAPLGLLSGLVGIGGGIFLAPLLHLISWDSARRIAGTATLFIFANSIAGIGGQLSKLLAGQGLAGFRDLSILTGHHPLYWGALLLAVAIGGILGSHIGIRRLPQGLIRRVTGVVVLVAGLRLLIG